MPEAAKTILNVLLILAAPVGKMPRIGKKKILWTCIGTKFTLKTVCL